MRQSQTTQQTKDGVIQGGQGNDTTGNNNHDYTVTNCFGGYFYMYSDDPCSIGVNPMCSSWHCKRH